MTKYFIDTEFVDTGREIDLISIGIAVEDGRELYLQSVEFDIDKADPWVVENVMPHLALCPHMKEHTGPYNDISNDLLMHNKGQCTFERPIQSIAGFQDPNWAGQLIIGAHTDCFWRTRTQIRDEIQNLIRYSNYGGPPEFIGWCAGYDFVVLCQLFGGMMALPQGWPHYIIDIQQILDERGISDDQLPQQAGTAHNALEDARHIERLWEYLHD